MQPFGERVVAAVSRTGPLCVGIDPSQALLEAWGLADDADGCRAFGERCVEALTGAVAAVKAQVAFFERHGAAGMAALEHVLSCAREAGLLAIADAKRGDVGSTAEAYAAAWFESSLAGDAVTATAYVGLGALSPMVDAARRTGRGLLVLVASSNPEGRRLQQARTCDGRSVEEALLAEIAEANEAELAAAAGGSVAARSVGSIGAVVGATRTSAPPATTPAGKPAADATWAVGTTSGRGSTPRDETAGGPSAGSIASLGGVILAPGLGAQGATVRDVGELFARCPPGTVLPSASRTLLAAGRRGLADAAARLRDELAAVLP